MSGIGKGEEGRIRYYNSAGTDIFLLTQKQNTFFLYQIDEDGSYKKLGKGKSPPELEAKFKVVEQMKQM